MQTYNFFLITIIVLLFYFFSFLLYKNKKISLLAHCRFWNVILLLTFLISALIGLILAFSIDQKLSLSWYLPFLWLHVETGIIMALVSIFHVLWHLPYFTSLLKKKSSSNNCQ